MKVIIQKIEFSELKQIPHESKKGYWRLAENYSVALWLSIDEKDYLALMKCQKGHVSDRRSGSSAIDKFLPKFGNPIYNAFIYLHDVSYSGYLKRLLADLILCEGWKTSGEDSTEANVGYGFVRMFGWMGYYKATDKLKPPYQDNRALEHLQMVEL